LTHREKPVTNFALFYQVISWVQAFAFKWVNLYRLRPVDLISNETNPKLTLPAVTAVMHMSREDPDAKQILTIAGVIGGAAHVEIQSTHSLKPPGVKP
jgi:hypothetical protein